MFRRTKKGVKSAGLDRPADPTVSAIVPTETSKHIPTDEIFSTAQIPPRSFVDREALPEIRQLKAAIRQGGAVACIFGDSRSGKTMFARQLLSESKHGYVLIQGSRIASLDDFWRQVAETLQIVIETERQLNAGHTATEDVRAKVAGSFSAGFASAAASVSARRATEDLVGTRVNYEPITSIRSKCVEFLSATKVAVILDDFHRIEEETVRESIASDLLTPAGALQGKYTLIAIPQSAFDFVNRDVQFDGRFVICSFPAWSPNDLCAIASKGFGILGMSVSPNQISRIASNAMNNPLNVQQICANICSNLNIRSTADVRDHTTLSGEQLGAALQDFAGKLSYFSEIIRIAAGTTETLTTYNVDGKQLNIYQLALVALSDAGANKKFGVSIATLRKKIRQRVDDREWNNPYLKTALERLASVKLEIKYRPANIPETAFFVSDDKVFVRNPLFRLYLFWCLLPSLGLQPDPKILESLQSPPILPPADQSDGGHERRT